MTALFVMSFYSRRRKYKVKWKMKKNTGAKIEGEIENEISRVHETKPDRERKH